VGVVDGSCGNHQSMRMECSDRDGGRSIAEETRVGLKVRYRLAVVDIEDLHTMSLRATTYVSIFHSV
jgi:hypothetical protein